MECRDPKIYCKFRTACPIWFEHKERKREARKMATLKEAETGQVATPPEN
jgi:hypothetical protein